MRACPIRYHTEETVVEAVHRLAAKSSTCRVAVAYCGEAAHRFFPSAPAERPEDLRIIVDASESAVRRGLTNPKGVKHLLGLTNRVRSLAGLHAKVFVFDEEVVLVGSVNMSAPSIEQQYQLTLEVSDSRIVRQLVAWFDNMWNQAKEVDPTTLRKLIRLWPGHEAHVRGRKTKAKLPGWDGDAPQPPPGPSEFKIGVSKAKIRKLLSEFRNNECPYETDGQSCLKEAENMEEDNNELRKKLFSMMRRCSSWAKKDLEKLFDLAFTYGKAAKFNKPVFVRQSPAKVARSLAFLLKGDGDPYVRFEKVLATRSPYKLNGMGEAGLTFLMHLWNPREFPVVNKPVDVGLKALKVSFGRATSRWKGQAFKDRTAAVRQIGKLTGLRTFVKVDHFLDAIAKGHIGRYAAS